MTIKSITWDYGTTQHVTFSPENDQLDFSWMTGSQFNINEVDGNVVVYVVDNHHSVILDGVRLADLSLNNIIAQDSSAKDKWQGIFKGINVNTPDHYHPDTFIPSTHHEQILTNPLTSSGQSHSPVDIVIKNPSFELDDASDGSIHQDVYSGWIGAKQNPELFANEGTVQSYSIYHAPDGKNFLEMSDGCTLKQNLDEALDSAYDYKLTVRVADTAGINKHEHFTMRLIAGDTVLGTASLTDTNWGVDNWGTVTLDVKGAEHLNLNGQKLSIELVDTQDDDEYNCYSGNGFFVDDVKLQKLASSMASFSPTEGSAIRNNDQPQYVSPVLTLPA